MAREELLVVVDGGVEEFETSPAVADAMVRSGARRIGRPARGGGPSARGQRTPLADTATTGERVELALAENPLLAALCRDDGHAKSKPARADLDALAERVIERLDSRRGPAPKPTVESEAVARARREAPELANLLFGPEAA